MVVEVSKVSPTFRLVIISVENKLLNKILKINKLNPKWAIFWEILFFFLIKKSLKVTKNKYKELENLSNKFRELKTLVYEYKEKKELEIKKFTKDQNNFKKEIDKNKDDYEKIIEEVTDKIESFVNKASSNKQVQ